MTRAAIAVPGAAIAAAAGAAFVALAACTSPTPTPTPVDRFPDGVLATTPATHPDVERACPVERAFRYDADSLPASQIDAAYVCVSEAWIEDAQGAPRTIQFVDRLLEARIPPLLETFELGDQPASRECDGSVAEPLIVWLHHGGDITPVRAPVDACGAPLVIAATAYAETPRQRVLTASETEGFPNG